MILDYGIEIKKRYIRNNKRIYHGDILQQIENKTITRCLVYADKGYGLEKMITLDNGSFYEDNMVDLCECDFYEKCSREYEVIGNIHTDSHLLTHESITQA